MNYDVVKNVLLIPELLFKGKDEIPIDFDFTLPDYCPDIGKILKCRVTPRIISKNISGDKLSIEGNVNLELLYLELNGNVLRCYKTENPFTHSFDLKINFISGITIAESDLEYLNCRAVSPRRIDIHGAFFLNVKVYGKKNLEISKEIINDDVQQLQKDVEFSNLNTITQKIVSISEILDIGNEKAAAESIIKTDISVHLGNYKCFSGKINAKGEIRIKILYLSDLETGKLENIDYEIPFNQDIDAPEASEDNQCLLKTQVIDHNEKITNDTNSDNVSNLINIDLKILFTGCCFEKKNEKILFDAYSINHELEPVFVTDNIINFENVINDQFSYKTSLDIPDNKILKLIDIWSDDIKVNLKNENNNLSYYIKIKLNLIALNVDSTPFYFEKIIEFSKEASIDCVEDILKKDYKNIIDAQIISIGYKISGDEKLDLKFEIKISGEIFANKKITFINEAKTDENKLKEKDSKIAIAIYYAKPGETVWDISKKYSTTVEKIKNENDLLEDIIDKEKAILVPMS